MWLEQDKNNCCLQDIFKRQTLTSLYHCHDLDDLESTKSSDSECIHSEYTLSFSFFFFCLCSLNFSSNLLRLNGNIWTSCSQRAQTQVYTNSAGADRTVHISTHTLFWALNPAMSFYLEIWELKWWECLLIAAKKIELEPVFPILQFDPRS